MLKEKLTSFTFWTGTFLMSLAFLIPFGKRYVPLFIMLLGIVLIAHSILKRKLYFSKKDAPLYLLALLFLLHVVGVSYSENTEYAWTEIGIKLSFICFPLLAILLPSISSKTQVGIRIAFITGCLLYLGVAVVTGIYDSITHNDFSYLSYELLSEPYHPTYAATYQAMAVFMLLQNPVWLRYGLGKRIAYWSMIVVMILFISMLASKAGLIAVFISILMGCYSLFQNRQSLGKVILTTFLLLLFSASTALYLPGVSSRIGNAVSDIQAQEHDTTDGTTIQTTEEQQAHSSTALRMVTWGASLQLLMENPIGVGTGDTTNELVKIYDSKGEQHASEKKLNAHNQFLQTGAELGWPALISLCTCLLLLFSLYLKNRDLLLLNFLLLCGMNFLFESFIEVQAGIVFFCFWILVFLRRE